MRSSEGCSFCDLLLFRPIPNRLAFESLVVELASKFDMLVETRRMVGRDPVLDCMLSIDCFLVKFLDECDGWSLVLLD